MVAGIYGLHESRPIAWRADDGPFRILQGRLVAELLARDGTPVADGEVGEITVTAGANPLLPLVRYRTGDYARTVRLPGGGFGLADLQGREHVVFHGTGGQQVPSVDLTQQLQARGALGWTVTQEVDGHVGGATTEITRALTALFGDRVRVEQVHELAALGPGKPRRYRSDAR